VLALVVALLALGISSWALVKSYDSETGDGSTTPMTEEGASTTIPLVLVPSVVGKNGLSAAADLTAVKLKSSVVRGPSVNVPRDRVISQNPQQGTRVPEGTIIELTLSSGPP